MKQLFIDLLTKCVPDNIEYNTITYKFKTEEKTEKITILWDYYDTEYSPEINLFVPFQRNNINKYGDGKKLRFSLYINNFQYFIEFNPIEINEVQHLIYQIFQQFQINKIQMFKALANRSNDSVPQTPEEQFETAQEAVAENVSE